VQSVTTAVSDGPDDKLLITSFCTLRAALRLCLLRQQGGRMQLNGGQGNHVPATGAEAKLQAPLSPLVDPPACVRHIIISAKEASLGQSVCPTRRQFLFVQLLKYTI
jgi:hypothetical protein